jgi:hypothetical protein
MFSARGSLRRSAIAGARVHEPGVTAWGLLPGALLLARLADAVHAPDDRLLVVAGVTDRTVRPARMDRATSISMVMTLSFLIAPGASVHLYGRSRIPADGRVLPGFEAQGHLVEGGGEGISAEDADAAIHVSRFNPAFAVDPPPGETPVGSRRRRLLSAGARPAAETTALRALRA